MNLTKAQYQKEVRKSRKDIKTFWITESFEEWKRDREALEKNLKKWGVEAISEEDDEEIK
jgi:hypothetical protein